MPYSAFKCNIFNCFKKALGTGEINSINYFNNISAVITDVNYSKLNDSVTSNPDFRVSNFIKEKKINDFYIEKTTFIPTFLNLENTSVTSYNNDTRSYL